MNDLLGINNDFKAKLLVVDDSVDNLKLMAGVLEEDYELRLAKNGERALELLEQEKDINLVLLDVMMPGIDGFEVCRRIKSDPELQHIPVIFLTGLNDGQDEAHGLSIGGADYIAKPFNTEVVKARIRTHLALQSERTKADALLRVLLPTNVTQELIRTGTYEPVIYDHASVLFCDLVGFTKACSNLEHKILINDLSRIFSEFDLIMERNASTRIKTMGDGYMAVSGLSKDGGPDHANNMVAAGLEMIRYLESRGPDYIPWKCRIGIHSGPVIAGIVGLYRFQFDVFGDIVNTASRVEKCVPEMHVAVTRATLDLLDTSRFRGQSIGWFELKGKGNTELYAVEG